MSELLVTEIFHSIQGESSWAGLPCAFVRLSGCPMRCRWCDTAYSFAGGKKYSVDEIVEQIDRMKTPLVELTGGEPLAQEGSLVLIEKLILNGYKVLIETGGGEPVEGVSQHANIIMDIKCPGSGMHEKMLWSNLEFLKATDEIKFVISNRSDFDWSLEKVKEFNLDKRFRLLFSPAWGLVVPKDLAAWLLESGLQARLNLQLHKFIWGPRAKGV